MKRAARVRAGAGDDQPRASPPRPAQNEGLDTAGAPRVKVAGGAAPAAPGSPGFPGINQTQSGFIPPDVQMAAGPFQIVEAVNGLITIFNKNGSTVSSSTPSAFFAGLGTVATDTPFDPQVVFDEYLQRFIMLLLDPKRRGGTLDHADRGVQLEGRERKLVAVRFRRPRRRKHPDDELV